MIFINYPECVHFYLRKKNVIGKFENNHQLLHYYCNSNNKKSKWAHLKASKNQIK